jgi:hypothetical protein
MITIFAIVLGFVLVITAMRVVDRVMAHRLSTVHLGVPRSFHLD